MVDTVTSPWSSSSSTGSSSSAGSSSSSPTTELDVVTTPATAAAVVTDELGAFKDINLSNPDLGAILYIIGSNPSEIQHLRQLYTHIKEQTQGKLDIVEHLRVYSELHPKSIVNIYKQLVGLFEVNRFGMLFMHIQYQYTQLAALGIVGPRNTIVAMLYHEIISADLSHEDRRDFIVTLSDILQWDGQRSLGGGVIAINAIGIIYQSVLSGMKNGSYELVLPELRKAPHEFKKFYDFYLSLQAAADHLRRTTSGRASDQFNPNAANEVPSIAEAIKAFYGDETEVFFIDFKKEGLDFWWILRAIGTDKFTRVAESMAYFYVKIEKLLDNYFGYHIFNENNKNEKDRFDINLHIAGTIFKEQFNLHGKRMVNAFEDMLSYIRVKLDTPENILLFIRLFPQKCWSDLFRMYQGSLASNNLSGFDNAITYMFSETAAGSVQSKSWYLEQLKAILNPAALPPCQPIASFTRAQERLSTVLKADATPCALCEAVMTQYWIDSRKTLPGIPVFSISTRSLESEAVAKAIGTILREERAKQETSSSWGKPSPWTMADASAFIDYYRMELIKQVNAAHPEKDVRATRLYQYLSILATHIVAIAAQADEEPIVRVSKSHLMPPNVPTGASSPSSPSPSASSSSSS